MCPTVSGVQQQLAGVHAQYAPKPRNVVVVPKGASPHWLTLM